MVFVCLAIALLIIIAHLVSLNQKFHKRHSETKLKIQDVHENINLTNVEIRQEEQAIKSFKEKIVSFSRLKGITERLSACFYLDETASVFSDEISSLFGEKDTVVIVYLLQARTGELGISSSKKGEIQVNLKAKKGDFFDEWVAKTMQPLLIEDVRSDYRFDMDKIFKGDIRQIRSLISIPLRVGNKTLGIVRVDSPKPHNFTTEDLRFLMTLGDLGAIAVENSQLYERVEQLAIRDGLTNLYLRRYLMQRLEAEISLQMRRNKKLSFLMLDLDNFKQYNDKYGHTAGDIVLRTVASVLKKFFKEPGNLVSRYGGEEFAILLPDCDKKRAIKLAEELRQIIERKEILLRRKKTHITVSIGVAAFFEDAQIKEDLIQMADQAMYQAKQDGRNCIRVAGKI